MLRRLLLTLPIVLGACAPTEFKGPALPGLVDAPPPPMAGADDSRLFRAPWSWQGTQMSDDARFAPDVPDRYTLQFEPDGVLRVRADCNRGSGTYSQHGNALDLGPIALTRMMCAPGSRDADFLKGLQSVSGIVWRGDELILTLKYDSGSMRFAAAPK